MMDKRTASYLLPDPGGKVVRELLDQIEKRDADLRKLVERMESLPNATQQTLEWAEEIRKVLDGRGE